ncbi:rod shape-determining protein MreC [Coralloluteibacterium thermophilus]|uniref:Cell shape-determining protein MreC n=1 Tax=Coralloluteibacterium thermophilum TaxID=2707049 RepID=A0ABV9NNI4_9GAMM
MPTANSARLADASGTLKLLAYLAAAVVLMAADHRGGWLHEARRQAAVLAEPVWWLAALPGRAFTSAHDTLNTHGDLREENARLRRDLQIANARLSRMQAVGQENARLRELLNGTRGYRLNVQLASIVDIDLDPYRRRVVLDLGRSAGLEPGQALIDAGGLVGQLIEVGPRRSTALLVTDPDHAVPVQVVRSGLRLVVDGTAAPDRLEARNVPQSGDIQVGDELVTSGIGGRFPAGFPVGTVTGLRHDDSRSFVIAEVRPAARIARSGEVLVVSNLPAEPEVGPPDPRLRVVPDAESPAVAREGEPLSGGEGAR